MKLLPPTDYVRLLSLVQRGEIRSHLAFIYTLLEERQEGKVFVDDLDNPRTALLCPASGFYFLYGDADTDCFDRFVPELLAAHLVDLSAVYATSIPWQKKLATLLRKEFTRVGFEFSAGSAPVDWRDRIPAGLTLETLTAPVIAKWNPDIMHWVVDVWGGPQGFEARSFGYCLLAEDRIVSIAAACAIGRGEAEIEVATAPDFQRRGLATLVCSAFVEHCLCQGLRPTWSCGTGHTTSAALGQKLGFVRLDEIHGYGLDATFQFRNGKWGPP
jgi:RimJ/RimL family protein N-acetyltransferase